MCLCVLFSNVCECVLCDLLCDVVGLFVLVWSFNVLVRFVFDLSCDVLWLAFAWCLCG